MQSALANPTREEPTHPTKPIEFSSPRTLPTPPSPSPRNPHPGPLHSRIWRHHLFFSHFYATEVTEPPLCHWACDHCRDAGSNPRPNVSPNLLLYCISSPEAIATAFQRRTRKKGCAKRPPPADRQQAPRGSPFSTDSPPYSTVLYRLTRMTFPCLLVRRERDHVARRGRSPNW